MTSHYLHFNLILFSLTFCFNIAYSQINLVENPDFEDTTACPFIADIENATGWFACLESPDYFNSCAAGGNFGVPENYPGYQYAFNGNGYAGIATYVTPGTYREHMGTQLSAPLEIGLKYFITAYFSRADSAWMGQSLTCATNNLGFKFSSVPYNSSFTPSQIDNFSHVHADSIITSMSVWTKVSGSFIADSAYTYLMIGNFYDNIFTDTIECEQYGYYYVDAVCVSTDSTFCVNYTGINESIEQIQYLSTVSISPNPFSYETNLNFGLVLENANLTIFNLVGQPVKQINSISGQTAILLRDHLQSGIYFIRLTQNNKIITSQIIIVME